VQRPIATQLNAERIRADLRGTEFRRLHQTVGCRRFRHFIFPSIIVQLRD
jgi:hypothetical protein